MDGQKCKKNIANLIPQLRGDVSSDDLKTSLDGVMIGLQKW